jgi:hypothetical protein
MKSEAEFKAELDLLKSELETLLDEPASSFSLRKV